LLYFFVDGIPMGGQRSPRGPANIRLRVHGTGVLDAVEIVKADLDSGEIGVARSWSPDSTDFDTTWTDESPPARGFYYARVAQRERYRDRVPMAWSSPVWLQPSNDHPPD
jgi:hypothetical protein